MAAKATGQVSLALPLEVDFPCGLLRDTVSQDLMEHGVLRNSG